EGRGLGGGRECRGGGGRAAAGGGFVGGAVSTATAPARRGFSGRGDGLRRAVDDAVPARRRRSVVPVPRLARGAAGAEPVARGAIPLPQAEGRAETRPGSPRRRPDGDAREAGLRAADLRVARPRRATGAAVGSTGRTR